MLAALEREGSAVGLDFSREQVRRATGTVPSAAVVQGELSRLPFPADGFDGLTAYHSLIHVPLAEHATVIEEFSRVLRPEGWLLLSEGSQEWSGSNPDWIDTGIEMQWSMAGPEATRSQLRDAGFTIEEEWAVDDELADAEATKPFFLARLG